MNCFLFICRRAKAFAVRGGQLRERQFSVGPDDRPDQAIAARRDMASRLEKSEGPHHLPVAYKAAR